MTHFILSLIAALQVFLLFACNANAGEINCKDFGMVKHPVHGRFCTKPENLLPAVKVVKPVKKVVVQK